MKGFGTVVKSFSLLLILVVAGFVFIEFYPYIFAKTVAGEVVGVERLMNPQVALLNNSRDFSNQVFSFAVGVKDTATNEIFTASSEDRQWAVVEKGKCAVAKFFPYPPWKLDKDGTYFNARLIKLYDCPAK